MKHQCNSDANSNLCVLNSFQNLGKRLHELKHHLDSRIVVIGKNSLKNFGDLKRLTVSQTPVRPRVDAGMKHLIIIIINNNINNNNNNNNNNFNKNNNDQTKVLYAQPEIRPAK